MNLLRSGRALAVAFCLPLVAWAQAPSGEPQAASSAPSLHYRSAFEGYRAYVDVEPGNWKALNEAVAHPDGMATPMPMGSGKSPAAANAVSAPAPAPAANYMEHVGRRPQPPSKPAMPGMADHAGHHMSGDKP